jgi:3'-5' exoribonuclease
MATTSLRKLSELEPGDVASFFVLLATKDPGTTRDGKPYFRVTFRDPARSATTMVWHDADWFADCEAKWKPGDFFKVQGRYVENKFGSQIEPDQIRPVNADDAKDGFDPGEFFETSRYNPQQMFDALVQLAEEQIADGPLRTLVTGILAAHHETLLILPAASKNHHAFRGGFLEHVLSVTHSAIYLADKYRNEYLSLDPPLSKCLVVAGAILHDIGKLQELTPGPAGATYSPSGKLIGHILLGRDIVREAAREIDELDPEMLLRLEHIIVSHQNRPEWGSPIAPHTPEALLVHYADDIDAKFQMMAAALREKPLDGDAFTSRNNALRRTIFRGLSE